MQALARTRSTVHSRLAELRAINEQLHTQLAALQSGWGEIQAANNSLRAVNGDLRRVLEHYGPQQPEKQL
jgi:regulator of replication initiation timing